MNFNSNGTFEFRSKDGGYVLELETDAEYRDPSAWYHVCCNIDTTQGVAANRAKIWINGVQQTSLSLSTYPAEDSDIEFNTSDYPTRIGDGTGAPERTAYDGYMAEFVFIDGTAYSASDFGEYDEDSPTIWKPKDPSTLTFGTNGYYLDFEDSSALGNDVSGNNNDFSVTNLAATDQATDTPTNNFATLNPLDNFYAGSAFAQGNCQATQVAGGVYGVNTSTIGLTKGKWYFEAVYTTTNDSLIGITDKPQLSAGAELGDTATQWSIYGNGSSTLLRNNNAQSTWGASFAQGAVVGVAIDMDNLRLYFANANTWMNSGDPTDGTGKIDITTSTGVVFPAVGAYGNTPVWQLNFGGCPVFAISSAASDADGYGNFEFAPPSGYFSICTKNLAEYG